MVLLVKIMQTHTVQEIKNLLTPYDDLIDEAQTLANIQDGIKQGFKRQIQLHQHPSVWYAIKIVDRVNNPKWTAIFNALPEALGW